MENLSNIKHLSNSELTDRVKWSQKHINHCIEELIKRHEEELKHVNKTLRKINKISNKGKSPSKLSVKERSINCLNTSTIISAMSDSEKTVCYNNDNSDCDSIGSYRSSMSYNNIFPTGSIGNDRDGKFLYAKDVVEILTPSKNGTPFKSLDNAMIMSCNGTKIWLRSVDDDSVTGYRLGKNLRLKESHYLKE